jgi:hypothetical protein
MVGNFAWFLGIVIISLAPTVSDRVEGPDNYLLFGAQLAVGVCLNLWGLRRMLDDAD